MKAKKFNVSDFCGNGGNDGLMPMTYGVYHEGGYKVATNLSSLVCHKENYDPRYEGKTIMEGMVLDDARYPYIKFPNYKKWCPNQDERDRMVGKTLDKKVLANVFADYSKFKKIKCIGKDSPFVCVLKMESKDDTIYFEIGEFEKIYSYMCETDNFTLYVPNSNDANEDGVPAIVDNKDAGYATISTYRFDENDFKGFNKDDVYKVYEI